MHVRLYVGYYSLKRKRKINNFLDFNEFIHRFIDY